MTLLTFLGAIIVTPIVGVRRILESATQTLTDIEKGIASFDRDAQINELKARIEHLESLLPSKSD